MFPRNQFEGEEVENSFPMDIGRRFCSASGRALVDEIVSEMRGGEQRKRRRSQAADERQRATVETLLVNLTAAAFNAVDPDRFVAVSFNRNSYAGTELDLGALQQCRNYLAMGGLITGVTGFQRYDADGDGMFSRNTRLRATDTLRGRIEDLGIGRKDLAVCDAQLIRLKKRDDDVPLSAPEAVEDSRTFLKRYNRKLSGMDIALPAGSIIELAGAPLDDEADDGEPRSDRRTYAGDLTATSLYRVFNRDWSSGGRIYGGWWMSVPKALRSSMNSP